MSQPFLGQIQPLAFNFAPRGWAQCNGQIMNISQNSALFALLGTTYGGNGQTTFGLPNLQSRVPAGQGSLNGEQFTMGEMGGAENVTIQITTMPAHSHAFIGSSATGTSQPPESGSVLGTVGGTGDSYYASDATTQVLNATAVVVAGGNQPHNNIQPYLTVNWCIATSGLFPARN